MLNCLKLTVCARMGSLTVIFCHSPSPDHQRVFSCFCGIFCHSHTGDSRVVGKMAEACSFEACNFDSAVDCSFFIVHCTVSKTSLLKC
jgi:hypothetical protein